MPEDEISSILDSRVNNNDKNAISKGLVVTISRLKGCDSYPITNMIIEKLNDLKYTQDRVIKWKLISKEILEQSADLLNVTPSEVDSIIDMNVLKKMLLSFSEKALPADVKIKNTIREVIQNAANQGNVIIVGRGGVSITRDMMNSLHVKLIAPFEWRVRRIATTQNISIRAADKIVKERDRQRDAFKQYFLGNREADMLMYDLTVDVSKLHIEEVADALFGVIKERQDALVHGH